MTSPSRTQPMNETALPKLVMGYIEVVAPDGEPGIPYDEALIHIEGDEDSEIEVRCPAALRIAPKIVEAVNSYASLKARIQVLEAAIRKSDKRLEDMGYSETTRARKLLRAALETKHD